MARPRRTFQTRGPRRRRQWARTIYTELPTDPTIPAVEDLLAGYRTAGGNTQGCTVGRLRVQLTVERIAGATEPPGVYFGIIAAPSTVDPEDISPTGSPHLDWMYWSFLGTNALQVHDIDVKSMRKLEEVNSTLWAAVAADVAANDYTIRGSVSALLLLP